MARYQATIWPPSSVQGGLSGEKIEWSDEVIAKTIAYPLTGVLVEGQKTEVCCAGPSTS
jgi:hypothetical protein